ncbi:Septal ring factor EnvC, activator of murein hydrolases AmiA and AmiB [Modicisalibacter ilicicola DSM 19980]|uniref:Septal ring factor EnvC, activator of murein hydrolases AmiA and AmiB n=1 Tax=Modicisalibacter ilicicola DSM 19980 TaxID=1121942 RepID=A0A1M4VQQ6_9GAMM|nr:peptidoglycan DD-metalloendopeptidase family protein [Halomonas ilicicola]SHE71142.1 Septal ring factor EnvC, activator of murein hydrolases AmiA and AmiB [Halomonas ilicicola DSM 19980]
MPGRIRHAVALALLPLLVQGPLALAQSSEREAAARVDAISEDIQALTERLKGTREARGDASRQLEAVETALGETHRRLDRLQAERRQLDDEIHELEQQREALRIERGEQRQALAVQIQALYRLGRSPQLKLLLNQDDPARLDRLQTYLNRLSRARNERIDTLARLDEQLAENRAALAQRRERLDDLMGELETQRATLVQRTREREALLAKLDARYADEKSRLAQLDKERAEAEQMLERIRDELKRLEEPPPSTAIADTKGKLPWPVQGKVLSAFGSGEGINRNGLVIAAAEGAAVKAIHPGRVVFADWMRGFGNLLILDHGDDIMSLYAHVQSFDVAVGERIERNDVIAAVGNTGGRPRPALYFEVRRAGKPIDPNQWIGQR